MKMTSDLGLSPSPETAANAPIRNYWFADGFAAQNIDTSSAARPLSQPK
jgi:hypothetical protein